MHIIYYVIVHTKYIKVVASYKTDLRCGEEDIDGDRKEETRNQYDYKALRSLTDLPLFQQ